MNSNFYEEAYVKRPHVGARLRRAAQRRAKRRRNIKCVVYFLSSLLVMAATVVVVNTMEDPILHFVMVIATLGIWFFCFTRVLRLYDDE